MRDEGNKGDHGEAIIIRIKSVDMNITIMFNFSFHFSILIPVPTGTTPPEVGVVPCPPPGSSPSV